MPKPSKPHKAAVKARTKWLVQDFARQPRSSEDIVSDAYQPLVEAAQDIEEFGTADGWETATTGRQILLVALRAALKETV